MNKMETVRSFWNDDQGQDLIEYTLLMAFVVPSQDTRYVGPSAASTPLNGASRHAPGPKSKLPSAKCG